MKKLFILLILCFNLSIVWSQTKVADNFFRDFAYYQATELYLEAVKEGDSSEHVLTRLGDCYYNNSDVKLAAYWYNKALKKYSKINPEFIYKYIQTQRSLNQYDEAKKWTEVFKQRKRNDKRIKNKDGFSIEDYEALKSSERTYVEFENLEINTEYSDFGAFEKEGIFYFASTRVKDTIKDKEKLYKWNQEPFLNIYQSKVENIDAKKTFTALKTINSNSINSDFHEASVAITNDGKTIYFTRDNLNKRKKVTYDKEGTSNLKIFKATLNEDYWENIEEVPINGDEFSTGSPALSPDNKTLYFASNREGGKGQTDIYSVAIHSDGTYGSVTNLGNKINTEGRENFPFVAKDSTFYFSSDAHLNLGLLDVFESNILKTNRKDKTEVEIKNLGAPFNSGFDDFAYFIDSETKTGYFSSNRPEGKGGDDIYSFGKFECSQTIVGLTLDKISNEPLDKVVVKLIDETGKVVEIMTTAEDGKYEFENLACETKYNVLAEKVIYRSDQREFTTSEINGEETNIDLYLTPLIIDSEIVINPIFFDYNKATIRPDAAYELENIVAVMREHPKMVIKIEAHTDSRGRAAYNLKLSDKRAKSTRDYLFTRGISRNRIESATGFGESQLINNCSDKVKCSEAEHQKNRRSKFIITRGYK